MKHRALAHLALSCTLLSVGVACREPEQAPPPAATPTVVSESHPESGVPFDLGEVMRRVHFAYRPDEAGGWAAGHGTWSAHAHAGGLTFTPRPSRTQTGTPVSFGAPEFFRGEHPLEFPAAQGEVRDDGSLVFARGGMETRLANGEDGVEQHWRWRQAPPGEGALRLRVPVQGSAFAGETGQGVHYADASGAGVRYGQVTWTDAAGHRTELRAFSRGNFVELRVPEELLSRSVFPGTLSVLVSPEVGLDAPVQSPRARYGSGHVVGTDGSGYLVVWTDERDHDADLYGARVGSNGEVLDPLGFPISRAPNAQENPAIAFDGTNYLVVWNDLRRTDGSDIYGARVSKTGTVLDPAGLPLATVPTPLLFLRRPALAFDGTNYLLAWEENYQEGSQRDLRAVRVNLAGATVGSRIVLSNAALDQTSVALSFDGTNYLAVWKDDRSSTSIIHAARISSTGNVLDPSSIPLSSGTYTRGQDNPRVAFDGTNHFVVWQDDRQSGTTDTDLYATRVSKSGAVLDPAGLPLITRSGVQSQPSVSVIGSQLLLAWEDHASGNGNIQAARVSGSGVLIDTTPVTVWNGAGEQTNVVVASNRVDYLLAWQDQTKTAIVGARMNAQGGLITPTGFNISLAANNETASAVAFDGTNYLAVWQDDRNGSSDIFGVQVSPLGVPLTPSGIAIGTGTRAQTQPAVAFDGTNYFVVWTEGNDGDADIRGARVSKAGNLIDAVAVTISARAGTQKSPAVAFDGTNYFVAWEDTFNGNPDIYGTRVNKNGGPLGSGPLAVSTAANAQTRPSIAFNGTNYLVAFEDTRTTAGNADIYASRVSPAGATLDPTGIKLASGSLQQREPSVASDGTNFLVVWGDGDDIAATRVGANGSVLGTAFKVSSALDAQVNPSAVYDGKNFLVAWEDWRGGVGSDIQGAYVSTAGVVQEPEGFVISANAANETGVALASAGPSRALVLYQTTDTGLGPKTQRLRARVLDGPPTANPQSLTTPEDEAIAIVLTGSDTQGKALTYAIATPPTHGTLTGTAPNLTYTPSADYHGPDSFTFTVTNGTTASAPATVTLTVTPVNDAPQALAQALTTEEDTSKALTLTGSDVDGDSLGFTVVTAPEHGTLAGTAPHLVYTPAADYHGPDSFSFTVSDGQVSSEPATVSLTVTPVNDAPVAWAQALTTAEDTAKALTLTGSDVDGDSLSFTVVTAPEHGTLTGTAPALTYTPTPDYHGPDSFTFTVSDGQATSAPATVSLTIYPVNDRPVASPQSLTTEEDTPKALTLTGSDVEGDPLDFNVLSGPRHGTLSGTAPDLVYTPAPDFHGTDSFTFTASDGQATSAPATVSLTVTPVNDAPLALAQALTTEEDTPKSLTLTGSDVDGDSLSFTVVTQPEHGTLTGTAPDLVYTPAPDFHGTDSFTFTVSDGQASSEPATVSLTVTPANDAPVAADQSLTTEEDTPKSLTLTGSDEDGDSLSFTVMKGPEHGTLTGTAPDLVYTPAADFHGADSFTFTVFDGHTRSEPATVSLTVTPVNDAPVARAQSLTTERGTAKALTLTGSDVDGDSLSFTVVTQPEHGTLTGTAPDLVYTPESGYHGADSFTFTVSDGQATSAPAIVSLDVTHVNEAPVANAMELTLPAGNPSPIYLTGSDSDGGELAFSVLTLPEVGTLTGTAPDLVYTPPRGFEGTTHFTYSVSDGQGATSAEVRLTVAKRSLTVSAAVDSRRPEQGQSVRFYANAIDEAGAPITLKWDFGDGNTSEEELPLHAFSAPGVYMVHLTATTETEEATTALRLRVRGADTWVLAPDGAASSVVEAEEGSALAFRVDESATPLTYTWDFGDGTAPAEGPTARHAWAENGLYTVTVIASGPQGISWVGMRPVRVHNAWPVPLPQDRVIAHKGEPLTVKLAATDAAAVNDPLRWELLSTDGALSADGTFEWRPNRYGLITVITRVIDDDGDEARLAFQLAMEEEEPQGCGCGATGDASGAFGFVALLLTLRARGFSRGTSGRTSSNRCRPTCAAPSGARTPRA
ncbi:PKD domain-containing protein [Melittangium boletus]|uniref:PKD domain-containing protein n=1 Tax=Melittangium boletus DSM 14713 TaxID=1294270 RepID=A0A250IJD7_9BACT|nr:PKD domain-containing protein [Melittangium boletus]ATB31292.1 PKD domain-containing protein [Melittangium boletus DSM 14713]